MNKCDRVGEDPLKLISDVEADLGIGCHAATWPIHRAGAFIGVYDRRRTTVHLFDRSEDHGASRILDTTLALEDDELHEILGDEVFGKLLRDIDLLDHAGHPFDADAVLAAHSSRKLPLVKPDEWAGSRFTS